MPKTITEGLGPNATGTVTAVAAAVKGKTAYSYAWAWITAVPQGVSFSNDNPTTIRLVTSGARGGQKQGTIQVTATDALGQRDTDLVTVNFAVPLLTLSLTGTSIAGAMTHTQTGATQIDASATNGVAPYVYTTAWIARPSTQVGIVAVDADSFRVDTTNAPGGAYNGSFSITVTDALGATDTKVVTLAYTVAALSVSLTPNPYSESIGIGNIGTTLVTAAASNGKTPYTYTYEWVSQPSSYITQSVVTSTTFYFATNALITAATRTGIFRVKVTDALGQNAQSDMPISITSTVVNLPTVYQMNPRDDSAGAWVSSFNAPVGIVPATDLVISWDGFMNFTTDTRYNSYTSGPTQLANRTVTQKSGISGANSATFGNRQPENDLPIYSMSTLAIGTLGSSAAFSNGLVAGAGSNTNYAMVYGLRNVYRGTDPARRVIGAHATPLTGGPYTSITVPGVTAPSDNSILMLFTVSYSANGYYWENGKPSTEWHHTLADFAGPGLFYIQMSWKLVPAGATGDLTFTKRYPDFDSAAGSVYKRVAFFVCIDSNTA